MDREKLDTILANHKLWIDTEREEGERADLRNADLRYANLDFSCLPLWCGSLSAKFDEKHYIQFLYHILKSLEQNDLIDDDFKLSILTDGNIDVADLFHRAGECGRMWAIGEDKP